MASWPAFRTGSRSRASRPSIGGRKTRHGGAIAAKYEHPLYTRMGELARKMGGHGGMDFLMLFRIIECLRTGQALDQNVYEGCLWSAVGPLSEKSVAENGNPQPFPDFTRGQWKQTKPLAVVA
jgi:hypothetical protein